MPFLATAKFPAAIAGVADLLNQKNFAAGETIPTLASGIGSADASFTCATGTGSAFATDNFEITVDQEIIFVASRTGDVCSGLVRGAEGTTPATHLAGAQVNAFITALAHNQNAVEINAIETTLGIGANGVVKSLGVPITAAQLKALSLNPITIIPAPGPGKKITILAMEYSFHPGLIPYTDSKNVNYALYLIKLTTSPVPVSSQANSGVIKIGATIAAATLGFLIRTNILTTAAITNPTGVITDTLDNAPVIFTPSTSSTSPILASTLTGSPLVVSVAYPGKGFAVNDVIQVSSFVQGAPGVRARFTVTGVDANGGVTSVAPVLSSNQSTIILFPCRDLSTVVISGTGSSCVLNVLSVGGGTNGIVASNVTSGHAGTGYASGDTGTVTFAGATVATYIVDTVSGGAVLTYHLTSVGAGYIIAGAYATATGGSQPGVGTGFQIDVTALGGGYAVNDTGTIAGGSADATYIINSVDANGNVLTYTLTSPGTLYTLGNSFQGARGGAQPGIGLGFGIVVTSVANDVTLGDGTLEINVVYVISNT